MVVKDTLNIYKCRNRARANRPLTSHQDRSKDVDAINLTCFEIGSRSLIIPENTRNIEKTKQNKQTYIQSNKPHY